ncbi:unnamed protein product, partial [Medioppia subpectinata]
KIIIGSRNAENNERAIRELMGRNPSANITALRLDLSSLQSVREFAKEIAGTESRVDVLINNAGGLYRFTGSPVETVDGYEQQLVTNYLGHYLLSLHLLPLMRRSPNARIINVSTNGHVFADVNVENINLRNGAYGAMKAHLQTKLAQVLFTREMARRLGPDSTVKTYAINPGIVNSRPSSNIVERFFKALLTLPIDMGPQTYLYCALDESLDNESGFFYDNCRRVQRMHSKAVDDKTGHDLWQLSADMVKLEANTSFK